MLWMKQYKPEEFDDSVMDKNVLNTGLAVPLRRFSIPLLQSVISMRLPYVRPVRPG